MYVYMTSIAIYAAPTWAETMDKRTHRTGIGAAQRTSALKVVSAFRTVSTDAVVMIAALIPLRLVVNVERRKPDTRWVIDLSNPVQLLDDSMK